MGSYTIKGAIKMGMSCKAGWMESWRPVLKDRVVAAVVVVVVAEDDAWLFCRNDCQAFL